MKENRERIDKWGYTVCLIPLLFALYCCIIKSGGFVDEYYSYGFANSSQGYNLIEVFDGNIVNNVITSEIFDQYIMVESEEAFSYQYIMDNCSHDLTPPLYYCVLHTVCSFFPNVVSKWFGLSINLVSYYVILFFLFKIGYFLYEDRRIASLITFCYGFSRGGLNNVTYIRMYTVVTMWAVMLTYFALRYVREKRIKDAAISGIIICLGFLTQYNFAFYAFFLCLAVCLVLFFEKRRRQLISFMAAALIGVLCFIITWPSVFVQIDRNLGVSGDYKARLGILQYIYYWRLLLSNETESELWILLILIVFSLGLNCIIRMKKIEKNHENNTLSYKELFIVLFGFILGTVCITYFAPFYSAKYCYITLPFFAVLLGFFLIIIKNMLMILVNEGVANKWFNLFGMVIISFTIIGARQFEKMDYLYLNNPIKLQITKIVSGYPCFFFNLNFDKAITGAIDHLDQFEDVYIVDVLMIDDYYEYISTHSNHDAIVVYVDTDHVVSSGLDSDMIINSFTDSGLYDTVIVLYQLDSSTAFLLCNGGYF